MNDELVRIWNEEGCIKLGLTEIRNDCVTSVTASQNCWVTCAVITLLLQINYLYLYLNIRFTEQVS
jgi:hypothetical protein